MLAVGAAVGLAALSRSELVLLALFLVVPLALLTPGASRRRRFRRAVLGLGAFAAVLAPWVGFNMARFDHTVLMSQNVGGTLATSNCDYVYYGRLIGYWNYQCGVHYLTDHHITGLNGAADRAEFNGGLSYIKSHLGRVPLVMAARVGRITGVFKPRQNAQLDVYLEYTTPWVSYWGMYLYYPVAILAVVGGVILRRRGRPVFPCSPRSLAVIVTVALVLLGDAVPGVGRRGALPAGRGGDRRRHLRRPRCSGSTSSRVDARVTSATSAPARSDRTWVSGLSQRTLHAVWSSWPRRVVLGAVVVGLALRVAWIFYAARAPVGLHDPILYLHLAQSLAPGRWLPVPRLRADRLLPDRVPGHPGRRVLGHAALAVPGPLARRRRSG